MKSLKESLIGNIRRTSLSDGSNEKAVKHMLDSPELIKKLAGQCVVFVGTGDYGILDPQVKVDKTGSSIRFIFPNVKNGIIQWELDWDKWTQFKLPKRIEISNYTKSVRFYKSPGSIGVICSPKKGIVEGLDLQVGDNKMLRINFENGLIFKNCKFDNYIEFNIYSKVNFDATGNYVGYLNWDNYIYNLLTGSYKENNLGFQWNHLKPIEIFKNCKFKYNCIFPLYFHYRKEQAYGTNFLTINGILKGILQPDMPNFDIYSKDMHPYEIK